MYWVCILLTYLTKSTRQVFHAHLKSLKIVLDVKRHMTFLKWCKNGITSKSINIDRLSNILVKKILQKYTISFNNGRKNLHPLS